MSVDEEINYPRMPVYTAKEYDELKAEVERWKERALICASVLRVHGKDWEAVWEGQDMKSQQEVGE